MGQVQDYVVEAYIAPVQPLEHPLHGFGLYHPLAVVDHLDGQVHPGDGDRVRSRDLRQVAHVDVHGFGGVAEIGTASYYRTAVLEVAMPDTVIRNRPSEGFTLDLPPESRAALARFLSERSTGNVTLNVKDGKILGTKIEALFR